MNLLFQKQINGKPTNFKRKIQAGLVDRFSFKYMNEIWNYKSNGYTPKIHSIREDKAKRWCKDKDIHFQEWYKTPYRSAMIRFAPIIKVVSVQDIWILPSNKAIRVWCKNFERATNNVRDGYWHELNNNEIELLSKNDGFDNINEFWEYFKNEFSGIIIHWTNFSY